MTDRTYDFGPHSWHTEAKRREAYHDFSHDPDYGPLPKEKTMTDQQQKERGLYQKIKIERTDGKSAPGEKHHNCAYFALDLDHDKFALPAIKAYAEACKDEFPALAADLWEWIYLQEAVNG